MRRINFDNNVIDCYNKAYNCDTISIIEKCIESIAGCVVVRSVEMLGNDGGEHIMVCFKLHNYMGGFTRINVKTETADKLTVYMTD